METYEEKYKKALEWMREVYPTLQGAAKEDAECYFPELKESEEERIRKGLIEYFLHYPDHEITYYDLKADFVIAWLEKQGELTDIPAGAVLDSNKDGLIADTIRCKREKQGEQKPEWNEEDERIIDRLCEILYDSHSYGKCSLKLNEYSNLYDWLKSLKDRVQPQPKQEWSEDCERYISYILTNCMYYAEKTGYVKEKNNSIIHQQAEDWLKSLRDRYTWKPSDEQMTALRRMKNAIGGEGEIYRPLNSLYEDLKKLREE